jgi:hypothetical protein
MHDENQTIRLKLTWSPLPPAHRPSGPARLREAIEAAATLRAKLLEARQTADQLYGDVQPLAGHDNTIDRTAMLRSIVCAYELEAEFWPTCFFLDGAIKEQMRRTNQAAEANLLRVERDIRSKHGVPDSVLPPPIALYQAAPEWWQARKNLQLAPGPSYSYDYAQTEREEYLARAERELARMKGCLENERPRLAAAIKAKENAPPPAPICSPSETKLGKHLREIDTLLREDDEQNQPKKKGSKPCQV